MRSLNHRKQGTKPEVIRTSQTPALPHFYWKDSHKLVYLSRDDEPETCRLDSRSSPVGRIGESLTVHPTPPKFFALGTVT